MRRDFPVVADGVADEAEVRQESQIHNISIQEAACLTGKSIRNLLMMSLHLSESAIPLDTVEEEAEEDSIVQVVLEAE